MSHIHGKLRFLTCWMACVSMLLAGGCRDKKPVVVVSETKTPKTAPDRKQVSRQPYSPLPRTRPAKPPERTKKVNAKDPLNIVQDGKTEREVEARVVEAESASASAQKHEAQARAAAEKAKEAAAQAAEAAAVGNTEQAGAAAAAAASSAKQARQAANSASDQAGKAAQHAQVADRAAQADRRAKSASLSASRHAITAAQHAAHADNSVSAARAVAAANQTAARAEEAALAASQARKLAEAHAARAGNAADGGDAEGAQTAAQGAQQAAKGAAQQATQAQGHLAGLRKQIESLPTSKEWELNAIASTGKALAEAQRAADAAEADGLAAARSAAIAKQHAQNAERKRDLAKQMPASRPATSRPVVKPAPRRGGRVGRPGGGPIDFSELPELPKMPSRRSRPKGIVAPTTKPATMSVGVVGRWRQVSGGTGPDFLPGGYRTSVIVFRADGVLEVRRTFDKDGAVSLLWRIGYEWNKDRTKLILGKAPTGRPLPASLKGFVIESAGIRAVTATQPLPVTLDLTRPKDKALRLGMKLYAPATK